MTRQGYRVARLGLGLMLLWGRAAQGGSIDSGETLAGVLTTSSSSNLYVFQGRAGDRIKVRMLETDPPVGPFLKLLDPSGKCFAYADSDCCQYRLAQLYVTLRKEGSYTIICKDRAEATGRYTVSMVCLPGCPLSTNDTDLGYMGWGQTMTGDIEAPGDLDVAYFEAQPGDHAALRMESADARLEPCLQLFGPDGKCLAAGANQAPRNVCEIDVVLASGGLHSVVCQDRLSRTGIYTLTLAPVNDGPFQLPGRGNGEPSASDEKMRAKTTPR